MGRMPWRKWYPSDYLLDTRGLSLAAKGAWSDLLNHMMTQNRGSLCMSLVGYARHIGATVEQTVAVLTELAEMRVCEVTFETAEGQVVMVGNTDQKTGASDVTADVTLIGVTKPLHVTQLLQNVTGDVTVISRRLYREESERKSTRERVNKFRKQKCNGARNDSETPIESEAKSTSICTTSNEVVSANGADPAPNEEGEWVDPLREYPALSEFYPKALELMAQFHPNSIPREGSKAWREDREELDRLRRIDRFTEKVIVDVLTWLWTDYRPDREGFTWTEVVQSIRGLRVSRRGKDSKFDQIHRLWLKRDQAPRNGCGKGQVEAMNGMKKGRW